MNESNAVSGIATIDLLGVAFVVLKPLGVIDWSWIWVTAPFWAPVAIGILAIVILFASMIVKCVIKANK